MTVTEDLATRPTLHMQRDFDAPRELVWGAWSKPEVKVLWLGPVEWPAISATQDFRVGGQWRACLKSASSDEVLWQGGTYLEIEPPERLVFTFKWDISHEDGPPADTVVTLVLSELPDGRTRMDFTHAGLKSERSLTGHTHGWTSTFERLEAFLQTRTDGDA